MPTATYQFPSLQRFYSLSLQHRDRAVIENKPPRRTDTEKHKSHNARCRRVKVLGSLCITGCHMIILNIIIIIKHTLTVSPFEGKGRPQQQIL